MNMQELQSGDIPSNDMTFISLIINPRLVPGVENHIRATGTQQAVKTTASSPNRNEWWTLPPAMFTGCQKDLLS